MKWDEENDDNNDDDVIQQWFAKNTSETATDRYPYKFSSGDTLRVN